MNPVLPIELLFPMLALVIAGLGWAVWWSTRDAGPWLRLVLPACRLGALLILAVIALNPGSWRREIKNESSDWVVLLDRSASMKVNDADGESRWQAALDLAGQAIGRSGQASRAKIYSFSDKLENALADAGQAKALNPDGSTTDILRSLSDLIGRYESGARRLAGVLLLSDGRQVVAGSEREAALRARAQSAPIFTLCLGGAVEQKDLVVTAPQRHYVVFTGQKIPVTVRLAGRYLGAIKTRVRLLNEAGAELASKSVELPDDREVRVELEFQAGAAGYQNLRVEADVWPGEADTFNNTAAVGVSILANKIKMLFVEGSPHWDTKFLLQLLRRQPHLQVTTVYRVTGERFFKVDVQEENEAEAQAVFPVDQAALNQYDIVAFGKGAEYFVTPERAAMLRTFVEERGGSIMFVRGKPYYSELPELASLEAVDWGGPMIQSFRWQPTPAGEQARLFSALLPPCQDPLWTQLPALGQAQSVRQLRPFAQVLVEGTRGDSGSQRLPLLITRRVGKGLTVTLNAEDLWRWAFFPSKPEAGAFYEHFWIGLVQWIAAQAEFLPGRRLALRVTPTTAWPGDSIQAVVTERSETADPARQPVLQVVDRDRIAQTLPVKRVPGRSNEWSTVFTLSKPGLYRLESAQTATGGSEQVSAAFEIRPPPGEEQNLSANPDLMARLAELSGGRRIVRSEMDEAIRSFAPREVTSESGASVWVPMWDSGWLLLAAAALLCGEWFLRRRNGLL